MESIRFFFSWVQAHKIFLDGGGREEERGDQFFFFLGGEIPGIYKS